MMILLINWCKNTNCEFLHYTVKFILVTRCHDSVHIFPFTSSELVWVWYICNISVHVWPHCRSMTLNVSDWECRVPLWPLSTKICCICAPSPLAHCFPSSECFSLFRASLFSDIEWRSFCLSVSVFLIVTYDRVSQTWLSLPDPSVSDFPLV